MKPKSTSATAAAPPAQIQEHPAQPDLIAAIRHIRRAAFILSDIQAVEEPDVYIGGIKFKGTDSVLVSQALGVIDAVQKKIGEIIKNTVMNDVGNERQIARENGGAK